MGALILSIGGNGGRGEQLRRFALADTSTAGNIGGGFASCARLMGVPPRSTLARRRRAETTDAVYLPAPTATSTDP
jgi:hypothetical protein